MSDAYVPGRDLQVEAGSLPLARQEVERRLLEEPTVWPDGGITEHLEHALAEGLWIREVLDDRIAERGQTSRVALEALADHRLQEELVALPPTTAGGVVVLAAVGGEPLDWVRDQHDGQGALVVATALANHRLWWNALTPDAGMDDTGLPGAGTLAELAGNTTEPPAEATIDDWLTAVPAGRVVTLGR